MNEDDLFPGLRVNNIARPVFGTNWGNTSEMLGNGLSTAQGAMPSQFPSMDTAIPVLSNVLPPSTGNWFSNWFDGTGFMQSRDPITGQTKGGWGQAGLGIAQGLTNAYLGYQQLQTYKQALQQSKDQFNANYAAQRQTTNTALEDRQRARVASNGSAYESVDSYMNNNRIK